MPVSGKKADVKRLEYAERVYKIAKVLFVNGQREH